MNMHLQRVQCKEPNETEGRGHLGADFSGGQQNKRIAPPLGDESIQQSIDQSPRMVAQRQQLMQLSAKSQAPIQRMLITLIRSKWDEDKKRVIRDRAPALAGAHNLGSVRSRLSEAKNLADNEQLWLYSHGSKSRFAGKSAEDLHGMLSSILPPGKRTIVLKGCKSKGVAEELQELLRQDDRYVEVTVLGMPDTAYTSDTGEMSVVTSKSREKAARVSALAEIRARRSGSSKKDAERAKREQYKASSRIPTVIADNEVLVLDPRMERRQKRHALVAPEMEDDSATTTNPQTPVVDPVESVAVPPASTRKKRRIIIDDDDDVATTATTAAAEVPPDVAQGGGDEL
jgi:hypothetical protein